MPNGTFNVVVSSPGILTIENSGGTTRTPLMLVYFNNPGVLAVFKDGFFMETAASGLPEYGRAGVMPERFGQITQGYLEASNAKQVEESARLRAFLAWKREVAAALLSTSSP